MLVVRQIFRVVRQDRWTGKSNAEAMETGATSQLARTLIGRGRVGHGASVPTRLEKSSVPSPLASYTARRVLVKHQIYLVN